MKIAVVSDDGSLVSQHFGRAPLYVVFTIEDHKIIGKEVRPKVGHHTFANHESEGEHHKMQRRGRAAAQDMHALMASNISDCQVLLAGGMGWGAYERLKSRNIEVIMTDIANIDEAVSAYLNGSVLNMLNRVH